MYPIVTQGLAGAGLALAQLVPLLLHYFRKWFLGRTPRQAYSVTFMMPSVSVLLHGLRSLFDRLFRPILVSSCLDCRCLQQLDFRTAS